jgi:hypothetical protein
MYLYKMEERVDPKLFKCHEHLRVRLDAERPAFGLAFLRTVLSPSLGTELGNGRGAWPSLCAFSHSARRSRGQQFGACASPVRQSASTSVSTRRHVCRRLRQLSYGFLSASRPSRELRVDRAPVEWTALSHGADQRTPVSAQSAQSTLTARAWAPVASPLLDRRAANPKVDVLEFLGQQDGVSRADQPKLPDSEQAAAMAVHRRDYGEQRFRRV